jgi:predicted alpha-1,2-mannosidase
MTLRRNWFEPLAYVSLCATLLAPGCKKAATTPTPEAVASPAQYADPRMGSGGYAFAAGNATPSASAPNGMMRAGPDTSGAYGTFLPLHFTGYWANDDTIQAFSHLHLHGTGARDYGVLGILPVPAFDPAKLAVEQYQSTFAKSSEHVTPGYYGVTLDNGAIRAELTATPHSSHERFAFPATTSTGTVVIDLNHRLTGSITDSAIALTPGTNSIQGHLHTQGGMSGGFPLYFAIRFKQPWTAQHVWSGGASPTGALTASGTGVGVALDFDTSRGAPVELQLGLSLISEEGAAANLAAELTSFDFETNHAASDAVWNKRLGALRVFGGTEAQRAVFYSALHHAFVMPGVYGDVDGHYNFQGNIAQASGFHFLNDMSLWDTYRTLNPLYDLIAQDVSLDFAQSLLAMAKIRGAFPKWPLATSEAGTMIGSSADVVLADAYVKGVTGFDAMSAYQMMRDAALAADLPAGENRGGRDADPTDYMANGFVPTGHGSTVSLTCEYNMDDFALSNFGRALGQTADADALLKRSSGWQKLYDPTTGLLREHTTDGKIPTDEKFDPSNFGDRAYDEADAYQSEFCAQHDVAGLAQVWGGKDRFVAALSDLFTKSKAEREAADLQASTAPTEQDPNLLNKNLPPSYYFGGNEPDIHYAYLFAGAGRPDLTQQWVPWIRSEYFSAQPDGIPGNDDGGTMASWYVFSALGFYPVPGSDTYIIGSPMFPKVEIQVPNGVFTLEADGASDANIYIQGATLNGQPLASALFHHADLKAGGTLVLRMGPAASAWGQTAQ